jgi:hypothetical protein
MASKAYRGIGFTVGGGDDVVVGRQVNEEYYAGDVRKEVEPFSCHMYLLLGQYEFGVQSTIVGPLMQDFFDRPCSPKPFTQRPLKCRWSILNI